MKDNLKFYICDDNIDFANIIKKEITLCVNDKRNCETTVFNSGAALLKQFDIQAADVVLLDIDMPEMNGFEVASLLQQRKEDIFILFVTSHEDKVYQSYDYHPFWFIRKSHMHDLKVVISKLLRKIDVEKERKKLIFNLKAENCAIEIDINTLMYIESHRNNIIIHDRITNEKQVRCKITEAEKQLYPFNIVRIQNGILVNCRYISKITSRDVILTDETHLGLSRSRIDSVREEYQNFIRRTLV